MITLGGVGSIVAVSLVGLFLVYVALPLFLPPSVPPVGRLPRQVPPTLGPPLHMAASEHLTTFWTYYASGTVVARRLDTGEVISRQAVGDSLRPSAWSFPIEGDQVLFGFPDGTVRLGSIGFTTEFLDPDQVPPELLEVPAGNLVPYAGGMVERTGAGQFRVQRLEIALEPPRQLSPLPIVVVDRSPGTGGPRFAALDAGGRLFVREVKERTNLLTGEKIQQLAGGSWTWRGRG